MEQQELSKAEKKALKEKRNRRRRLIRRIKVGAGLCFVLAVVLYLLCALVFFKVGAVKVVPASGDGASASSYYSDEEIIRVTGVDTGDSLVLVSKREVKETVETLLPYIGKVTVKRSYPSTLKIIVEDTSAFFAVESNGIFTLLNRDFKVLGNSEYIPDGCAKLDGVDFSAMSAGQTAEFEDEANRDRLNTLISECENSGVTNITGYDLSNIANVKIVINSRITLILGTITDLADKLGLGLKTIEVETAGNENAHIIIDITDPDRSYVRDDSSPIIDYAEPESESESEPETAQTTQSYDVPYDDGGEIVAVG